jgi:hypothetical protein|tara:strand:+ start:100 stop:606 length:507 start_codon:yes stop_codon:yes gene_type:complete
MGNSTFSGPIRSESTVKTVSKNTSTGAITEIITMGDAPVALGDEDKTLDAATHSGRTLVVPAVTANRTITLPAPVAGQTYKLIYGGAAEETENLIIVTPGNSNFFLGGVVHMDSDADNVSVYSDGNSNSKLTLTDFGIFEINIVAKDSTNYYIWGYQEGADAPAFADQ